MPIDMPEGFIVRSSFGLVTNTQVWTSPITRHTQRAILGGARWEASYTVRKLRRGEVGVWQAFLLALDGMYGTFHAYDPDRKKPQGPGNGLPRVNGANQTGSTLIIDGCTPSIVGWLKAGDLFSVAGQLKQLTADASTNALGQATLQFKPVLRGTPPDNTPIILDRPTCTMILADDRQAIWDAGVSYYEEKTFSAYEVFS